MRTLFGIFAFTCGTILESDSANTTTIKDATIGVCYTLYEQFKLFNHE